MIRYFHSVLSGTGKSGDRQFNEKSLAPFFHTDDRRQTGKRGKPSVAVIETQFERTYSIIFQIFRQGKDIFQNPSGDNRCNGLHRMQFQQFWRNNPVKRQSSPRRNRHSANDGKFSFLSVRTGNLPGGIRSNRHQSAIGIINKPL